MNGRMGEIARQLAERVGIALLAFADKASALAQHLRTDSSLDDIPAGYGDDSDTATDLVEY